VQVSPTVIMFFGESENYIISGSLSPNLNIGPFKGISKDRFRMNIKMKNFKKI